MIYWNKEKGLNFIKAFGLQLPAKLALNHSSHETNIKTEQDFSQYTDESSIRYSHSTLQSVANMASTGQITQNKGFIRSLITGNLASAFNHFTQEKNSLIESVVSAPVLMNNNENILTVIVREDISTRRMYLHSIMLKEHLLNPRVSSTLEKTSRTHTGSLNSTDIHNILQKALTYNIKSEDAISDNTDIRYSRSTPQSIAQLASTGQVTQDKGFIRSLITGDLASAFNYFTQAKNSLIESVVNHLHPVAT